MWERYWNSSPPGVENSPIHLQFLVIRWFFLYRWRYSLRQDVIQEDSVCYHIRLHLTHFPHSTLFTSVYAVDYDWKRTWCKNKSTNLILHTFSTFERWKTQHSKQVISCLVGLPVYQHYGLEICFKLLLCCMTVHEGMGGITLMRVTLKKIISYLVHIHFKCWL